MKNLIPLYSFFSALQQHKDFEVGVNDYFDLLKVLRAKPTYFQSLKSLYNLCKMLWLKPGQSNTIFKDLFIDAFSHLSSELANENVKINKKENAKNESNQSREISTDDSNVAKSKTEAHKLSTYIDGGVNQEIYLNITINNSDAEVEVKNEDSLMEKYNFLFDVNYLPISLRATQQQWRLLKKMQMEGITDELDINKSINKLVHQGLLLEPVMQVKKRNVLKLLNLIDCRGSMVAFQKLTESITQSAKSGAGIENHYFYFQNLPVLGENNQHILYTNSQFTDCISLEYVLDQLKAHHRELGILIISDGGAARGNFNPKRVDSTYEFLQLLYNTSNHVAWLNPIPTERWKKSTVRYTSKVVPMFETDKKGIQKAVQYLRGKKRIKKQTHFYNV